MGFMSETLTAELDGHTIEVVGRNDILRGLLYTLSVDGTELVEAQNLLKLPTHKTLEATVNFDGIEHHLMVEVKQGLLSTDYILSVDGKEMPLKKVA